MKKYCSAGVFKLDIEQVGFDELKKIAKEWSSDKCFHELIVRKVSDKDYGIQFVYISDDLSTDKIVEYEKKLNSKYKVSVDYCNVYNTEGIIVMKAFKE